MPICGKTCFILDLDGTVYLGDTPITGTIDFIRQHWATVNFYFLSNNTSKAPATLIRKLQNFGIAATAAHVLSPTTPLVAHLRAHALTRVFLVGNADYTASLRAAMPELELTPKGAQAVILAYDTELTYEKLRLSAVLLQNPAVAFLATHPDLVCPDPLGPLPDVGSFIAMYKAAINRTPEHCFGKPAPQILNPLLALYPREHMVMVGDRLATDKALADNTGIDAIVVLSGEATVESIKKELTPPWRTLHHLGELL